MRDSFVILDAHGRYLGEQNNVQEAIAEAKHAAKKRGGGVYASIDQLEPDKEQNPATASGIKAYRQSKLEEKIRAQGGALSPDGDYHIATKEMVMGMSLPEAHALVRKYLPAAKKWGSPVESGRGMFQPNTKMAKMATELFESALGESISASSYGMSLLPHYIAFRGGLIPSPTGSKLSIFAKSPAEIKEHYSAEGDIRKGSWCVGSSEGCRATCLVYSGQNQVADESILIKHALSQALLNEPLAYLRLMVEGIRSQMLYKGAAERWVRLNVYQDIPWEVMFPDLFLRAGEGGPKAWSKAGGWIPELRAYDYTKTLDREFLPNYDLTFSYNGGNKAACKKALASGRNVAAVFVLLGQKGELLRSLRPKEGAKGKKVPLAREAITARRWSKMPLRERHKDLFYPFDVEGIFGDVPVLNGDVHDIRPYDRMVLDANGWEGGALVGLDFKIPQVKTAKGKTEKLYQLDDAGTFVMRVKETADSKVKLLGGGVAAYMLTEIT